MTNPMNGPFVDPSQPDILGLRWDQLAAAKARRAHLRSQVVIVAHGLRRARRDGDQERVVADLEWIASARREHARLVREYGI